MPKLPIKKVAKKKTAIRKRKQIKASYLYGDASAQLDILIKAKRKFQLIMTSPPYNMDKEYEKNKSLENYKAEIEAVIVKLIALLDKKGSICWQVGNYINPRTKEVVPLDIFYQFPQKMNLQLVCSLSYFAVQLLVFVPRVF